MNEAREMVEPGRTHPRSRVDGGLHPRAGRGARVPRQHQRRSRPLTPPRVATTTPSSARRWCVSTSASTSTATSPTPRSRWTTRGPPRLVEAAEMALRGRGRRGRAGCRGQVVVGQAIEDVIRVRLHAVLNLSGHGVERYDAHTGPTVPNRGVDRSVELEPGQAVAIEPFATDGRGKVGEGTEEEIFERQGSGASATAARDRPSTRSRRSTTSRSRRGGWKATA